MSSHEDVLCDVQIGEKCRFLLDNGDTSITCLRRIMQFNRFPIDLHGPHIWAIDTGQDLDQRTLARPVFSHERMDLP